MTRCALVLAGLVVLGGCTGALSRGQEDAYQLHDAARAYVKEAHDRRREIRAMCWQFLLAEVRQLEADGDYAGARARLRDNYPGLVTIEAIKQLATAPEDFGTEPFGCQ